MSSRSPSMRILVVRSALESFYEPSWVQALRDNGHHATIFDTFAYLTKSPPTSPGSGLPLRSSDRLGWWQHRLLWGPRIAAANRALIAQVGRDAPDVVLFYLGHHYTAETVRALRRLSFVTLFHSDDPFGPRRRHPRYRLLHATLPWYHGGHFYRPSTTVDAKTAGLARSATLLDFYRPWTDYPRGGATIDEAAFIGHFEPDGRADCIAQAVRAGLAVRVYSNEPQWCGRFAADVARVAGPRPGLYDDAYREKLSRVKVSICFLSRWNRDEYTRRVFEIPACGGFLLCERRPFMQTLYEEDLEAVYFEGPDEFADKLRFYLRNDPARRKIAAAGHARLLRGGHDIHSRLRTWTSTIERWMAETERSRCAS